MQYFKRNLKPHFEQKESRADYSKNIWKEEKRGHVFVRVLVLCFSVEKNYRKDNSVGAGAHEVGRNIFLSNVDLHSPKKVNHIHWKKLLRYCDI